MNGTEHYREAERLIAAGTHPDGSPIIRSDGPQAIALAQVHATLAVAAAVGGLGPAPDAAGRWGPDERRWREIVAPEHVNHEPTVEQVGG